MITYLLGAGASFNSLPLGSELGNAMLNLSEKLKKITEAKFEKLIIDLEWLSGKSKEYGTVDSFARTLDLHVVKPGDFIKASELIKKVDRKDDYRRLKDTLNAFLIISQYKKLDTRYNEFLSKIIVKERPFVFSIKNNVKILSWNYDNQIEIAFGKYYENSIAKDVHAMIASYPSPFLLGDKYYHADKEDFDKSRYVTSIIHLNGVAGLYEIDKNTDIVDIINSKSETETITSSLSIYDSENSYLNFSWDDENKPTIDIALKNTKETKTLIIIGYSLPVFNIEADKEIFSNFEKLEKVYFQNRKEEDSQKETELEIIQMLHNRGIKTSVDIKFKYNVESFFVPDEII